MRPRAQVLVATALAAGTALAQPMSTLDPATAQARDLAALAWWMFGVGAVVLVGVTVLVLVAVTRARNRSESSTLPGHGRRNLVVAGGVLLPLVASGALLVWTVQLAARSPSSKAPADAIDVEVIGHRWWWEIHYLDGNGQRIATVANELHAPVGRAVRLHLKSEDVIHSFWAPNLQGKADMIPGRTNMSWFTLDREGVFRGHCAEFCGVQHAMMAFLVVGQSPEAFDKWLAAQAAAAAPPGDDLARQGQALFTERACVLCHAVRGTIANGSVAPDLTHVGTRRTLAAGRLPNTRGSLAAWIADPQSIKPGTQMPATRLTGDELNALVAYVQGLR